MVKAVVCSDVASRKVSKGPGWKMDQIGIELERPVKMLLKTVLVRDEELN